ncbi:sensor histidine kinase [Taibaiella koreensis]|uniref:sensor histidine kinase n=1 Tax=Taibaiella koreensis TaxID=1268548 RepID=UPI000E59ED53|nr:HAMP domain-containing sensor histidine kinase [Taibaiella koreensis]
MQLKLTRLVWITCIALLGIVALQVFWLFRAYEEQEEKLLSAANAVMLQTHIRTGVNASLNRSIQSLATDMLDKLDPKGTDKDTIVLRGMEHHSVSNILPETLIAGRAEIKQRIKEVFDVDNADHKSYTLSGYKEQLEQSLRQLGLDAPFELALVDGNGGIVAHTGTRENFERSGLKTELTSAIPVTLGPRLEGRMQLAFPKAGFYLLKGMWVVLVLSLCFIGVCAFSFSYMVALFYKQKKEAEIRTDFMNNMTHELKTPIASISVALELLQDHSVTVSDEVKDEYFSIAGNELGRLSGLIDKVLRMSAFERTQIKISRQTFEVKEWVDTVMHSVRPLAEANQAHFRIAIYPETLEFDADKQQLSSVLQNLLENAIKYADKNKPRLNIEVIAGRRNGKMYLQVKDNGKGIPEQYQDRIFDKFFRVPTGDEHEIKGYGLGLSYACAIVRLHHGDIVMDSELKRGTTFTITLPEND